MGSNHFVSRLCLWLVVAVLGSAFCLGGIAGASGPRKPKATRIRVAKGAHTMTLLDGETPLAVYRVAIGPGGAGVKQKEGDKVTPVGRYHVVSKGPSTSFHRFLRLDYPNADDRARFAQKKARGELAAGATIGGDIGIHGAPRDPEWKGVHKDYDWTLGCIAVDDDEIDAVSDAIAPGIVVDITD
jgi:murein L,D-transpeptidase YafK